MTAGDAEMAVAAMWPLSELDADPIHPSSRL